MLANKQGLVEQRPKSWLQQCSPVYRNAELWVGRIFNQTWGGCVK